MKKLMRLSLPVLVITSLLIGSIGVANAQLTNMPFTTEVKTNGKVDLTSSTSAKKVRVNVKSNPDLEAYVKTQVEKCNTVTDNKEKEKCFVDLEAQLISRFSIADNATSMARELILKFRMDDDKKVEKTEKQNDKNDEGKFFANFQERFERLILKLEAVYERMTNISNRIESRMKKLSDENVDVTASMKLVTSAREELRLAKLATESAETSFKTEMSANSTTTVTASNVKTLFAKTFTNIKSAKDHFKSAHHALVQAIVNLKPGQKTNASTTVDVKSKIKVNMGN